MANSQEVDSRGPAIVIVAIISPIIAGIFVALRIYTRMFLVKAMGWEDCEFSKAVTFWTLPDRP